MKKTISLILAAALLMGLMAACGSASTGGAKTVLNPADYETDLQIMTVADMPPNLYDPEALQHFKDLGMDIFLMTEDNTPFLDGPAMSQSYKDALQILTDAGFDIWIRNYQNDPDYFQLDSQKEASNYGWNYTMYPRNITEEFSEYPAVTGFYMMDEPFQHTREDLDYTKDVDESLFPAQDQLDKLIEWKNTYYPALFWHVNHVGSGSWDHWPEGNTYADFIDNYVETVLRKLEGGGRSICMDNYPLPQTGGIREAFLHDVLILAHATKNYNDSVADDQKATMGICLQTMQDANLGLRDITSSSDVTFQMYAGMAGGARLFEYFAYRSFPSQGIYGIIDLSGNDRLYDYVLEANQRALPFERVVCAFDWYGMTVNHSRESGEENIFEIVKDLVTVDNGVLNKVESRYDAIVGCFKKGTQDGYMVVNYTDPTLNQTNMVTLHFTGCTTALVYTEEGVEQVDLLKDGSYRITLGCGQAAFVIPA